MVSLGQRDPLSYHVCYCDLELRIWSFPKEEFKISVEVSSWVRDQFQSESPLYQRSSFTIARLVENTHDTNKLIVSLFDVDDDNDEVVLSVDNMSFIFNRWDRMPATAQGGNRERSPG